MDPDYRQDLIEKVEITVHMKGKRPPITMTAVPDGPHSRIVWHHEPEFSDVDNDTFLRMVPTGRHDFTLFLKKVRVLNGDEETR